MAERDTYGGFFPLEPPGQCAGGNTRIEHLNGALSYYNARSAIVALIGINSIHDVVLPHYICPVVNQAVEHTGAMVRYCSVNSDFTFDYTELAAMARDRTLFIIPSYFGVCMPDIQALASIRRQSGCGVLLDYAQALYEPCGADFSAVYSPRKFLGVTDGGFLVVGSGSGLATPEAPTDKVERSVFSDRLTCHGNRLEYPDGDCLSSFRSLENNMPCGNIRMSDLALSVFTAFDHDSACEKRIRNYETLTAVLGEPLIQSSSVPLCFPMPIRPEEFDNARHQLIEKGVFIPYYWPGCDEWMKPGKGVLAFPVDHRYDSRDMASVSELSVNTIQRRSE